MIGGIGFVRSRRHWGAWAGVAALARQIILSFGHMHGDDLGLPPLPAVSQDQVAAGAASVPAGPANPDHHQPPDDYCPICASMVLMATAMPSLPPILIAP